MKYNFTNEGGHGTIRFLKNLAGLWPVQSAAGAGWREEGVQLYAAQRSGEEEDSRGLGTLAGSEVPERNAAKDMVRAGDGGETKRAPGSPLSSKPCSLRKTIGR